VRIASALLLILALTGCGRKTQNSDAVRQGVLDHLTKAGLNVQAMDVKVTAVQFNGNRADATVAITPKGTNTAGMSMTYQLEQQGGNWVVVGRPAGTPHGGMAMPPSGANPHGGGMAAPGAPASPGGMPAPEDLPPAGQKK